MRRRWILFGLCMLTVVLLLAAGRKAVTETVIVIDSGHGGVDPGKIGVAGTLEKEINLKIACKVKEKLTKKKYQVIMTRDEDEKVELKERVALIEEHAPELAVSIHQNSFTRCEAKGAQVFYYTDSTEGKIVAELLQQHIVSKIGDGNHRVAKGNREYYMLSHTTVPFAIVECGFLSNVEEEKLLSTEEYQEKMADAITEGIIKYLEK